MQCVEFITKIQAYYQGTYNPVQTSEVRSYLQQYSEQDLDDLFQAVIRVHSTKWKCLPDVALFEQSVPRMREMQKQRWREYRLNHPERLMITEEHVSPEEGLKVIRQLRERLSGRLKSSRKARGQDEHQKNPREHTV